MKNIQRTTGALCCSKVFLVFFNLKSFFRDKYTLPAVETLATPAPADVGSTENLK